jgi:hypothetical protein
LLPAGPLHAWHEALHASQSVIHALGPDSRNRLDSAFMTACFPGSAAPPRLLCRERWNACEPGFTGESNDLKQRERRTWQHPINIRTRQ